MPRLTAELIQSAPVYLNPLNEREINLRGFSIPAIENLGVTEDEYEVIDLSDNSIVKLDNFPLLTHLTTLILNNNSIQRISPSLTPSLPHLTHLILTNNRLTSIHDLHPLHSLPRLTHLSLRLNPITRLDDYRLRVLHVLPRLKQLDYEKVREKERQASQAKYGQFVEKKDEQREEQVKEPSKVANAGILQEQMKQLIAAIQSATSLDEITRLEQQLTALHQLQSAST